mgnify:CR=1 FL=1
MNDYPSNVKEKLNFIISDMASHHWLFANRPGHDFMRQNHGKLSFYDTMRLIIGMGKGNTNDEIMDYFDLDPDRIPSQSAFIQRRAQISLSAFEYLFSEFSSAFRNSFLSNQLQIDFITRLAAISLLVNISTYMKAPKTGVMF